MFHDLKLILPLIAWTPHTLQYIWLVKLIISIWSLVITYDDHFKIRKHIFTNVFPVDISYNKEVFPRFPNSKIEPSNCGSSKQECIPVGSVPPACCPYLPACTAPRGVPAPGGCTCQGGCTCWGCTCRGGVPAQGSVPAWGYLPRGVVYLPGGYTCQGGTCPGTPPCEQNDRQVQKYYLAPNFICGR